MASNNEWIPVGQKRNSSHKKSKENEYKSLHQLEELFGSIFESDIIKSVARNYNWHLEPSIDALISLSSTYATPHESNMTILKNKQKYEDDLQSPQKSSNIHYQTVLQESIDHNLHNCLKTPDNEYEKMCKKVEKTKNIKHLDRDDFPELPRSKPSKKVGTESLCGLKVQYRLKGTENSDDDADVVIEEESSDYRIETPEPERVNVCQFLSAHTQCPPRNTFPKVNYINTSSLSPLSSSTSSSSSLQAVQRSPSLMLPTASSHLEEDITKGYKIMILMRGAPGSGKTYLSRSIISRTMNGDFANHIFSVDDYFLKINRGVYVFDSSQLQMAHNFNYQRVQQAVRQGISPIIVDNTNTRAWEMQNYTSIAVTYGYMVETLEPDTPWSRNAYELDKRNTHNVPKAKIRMMLERYEPNLTGERLLKLFSLKYDRDNQPPQIRQIPPYNTDQPSNPVPQYLDDREPHNSKRTDRPKEVIRSESLNKLSEEFAKQNNSASIGTNDNAAANACKSVNESRPEGGSGPAATNEHYQSMILKLGAIGSERRVLQPDYRTDTANTRAEYREAEPEQLQVESKSELPDELSEDVNKNCDKNNSREFELIEGSSVGNCWDFTLLLNGVEIHSKFEDIDKTRVTTAVETTETEKSHSNESQSIPEDIEVSNILSTKIDNDLLSSDEIERPAEASSDNVIQSNVNVQTTPDLINKIPSPDILQEISTPSSKSKSNSNSSSLERVSDVDISQFEMYNAEMMDDKKIPNSDSASEIANSDKQSTGSGLGLLFSIIKNSIIGSDKETDSKKAHHNDNTTTTTSTTTTTTTTATATTTATTTTSESVNANKENKEGNNNLSPVAITNSSSMNLDRGNELFEVSQSPQKESVMNIVEELLEASSDVQLIDQPDFSERKTATKSEELEKNIRERMENLHIRAKSDEDENKVSKEPIHLVFGGKNIFPEKVQATSNLPVSNGSGGDNNGNVANVYLVNWHESPFPLDEVPLAATAQSQVAKPKPESCDRGTYTDPFDFNVAYVGGTDDYVIIEGVNRSITDLSHHSLMEEPLMQKLMLHKSTMTNSTTLLRGPALDIDIISDEQDYSEELIDRFSHLPRACVLDIYENLCRRDYGWALDYLSNMEPDDVIMYETIDNVSKDTGIVTGATEIEKTAQSNSSESSTEAYEAPRQQIQNVHPRSKRERYKASDDLLALKQQFEEKFVMSEESYAPNTLRVKRWKRREFDEPEIVSGDLINFYEQSTAVEVPKVPDVRKPSRLDHPAMEEEEDQPTEDEDSIEDEVVEEETMELRLGYDFIRILESEFGSANWQAPEGLFPVIQIRRSMAQELHALWIESVQQQLWVMQEQLDTMIAKDAEYARLLEAEETKGTTESDVPNLKEIMDMEMALATYSNDCVKQKYMKKTQNDLASHVTQQTLHEMFPGYDPEMLYEIYEAHERNFDETVKVIEENCSIKSTITMADVLKKRKNLIEELQKESSYQTSRHNQLETLENCDEASGDICNAGENLSTYEDAIEVARNSRAEARRQLALRNQNYQKASEAYRRRNPEVAAYYSDVAKLHIRNMEAANSMAATAFLDAQTRTLEADDTLDLHFFHVHEAIQALNIFIEYQLRQLTKGGRKYIFIITGRGARSSNGQSKIKPVVVRKLNSKNIRFSEANPGMLKALLRKK